ncbi:hypothetical protein HPC49_06980 [Pyxidicoccus fallax]|uniref:Lipoprotein n=1 Tax=Pyxidicoccus fallax TaxID=394095 RepID=A0A848L766_9BACT|nr:hypothetical protein [Pyxidicoccus fallax]NMO14112.1 hypothetical protein [Pyxidicoccus fallax]NPC77997.1 hypothetical protein [Pyxidicoccus fallax]
MRNQVWCSVLAGALVSVMAGCGEKSVSPDGEGPDAGPVLRAPDAALVQRIEEVRTRVLADTCFREHPGSAECAWVDHPFDPAEFSMTEGTGEAILVVDDFRGLPPMLLRYRNRLRGYFRTTEDGTLAPIPFTWHLPAGLHDALTAFAGPGIIPAEWLSSLWEPLNGAYGSLDLGGLGHGYIVLSLLVEASPRQPLVLWKDEGFEVAPREAFCAPTATPETLEPLHAHARRKADSLRSVMRELNVRFINFSRGETVATLRDTWARLCGATPPSDEVLRAKLLTVEPVMEVLFGSPGVFAAHAAGYVSGPDVSPFDFPSERHPNRLRVGFFNSLDSGLDAEGHGPYANLEGQPAAHAVDIYLNAGIRPSRPFDFNRTPMLQVDGFGVSIGPFSSFMQTSWMAPIALSTFIYRRDGAHGGEALSDALIQRIIDEMIPPGCADLPGGRCSYQDPLKFGQTEAMRLGYRAVEYAAP